MPEVTPSPSRRGDAEKEYVVARVSEVPPGECLIVSVLGREIGVFNIDGRLHAVLNRCPHRGGELCKGDILGWVTADAPGAGMRLDSSRKLIACPWHGWEFDIETGQSWYHRNARPVRVDIKNGAELEDELARGQAELSRDPAKLWEPEARRVKGPYQADIYPVRCEDDYVVISMSRLSHARARR